MASLLTPQDIRRLAEKFGVSPTKKLGQNFVVDQNTVRKIVQIADVGPENSVLEVGPGLGSLTLGLLEAGSRVIAVEIDATLAQHLPDTQQQFQPQGGLTVIHEDALKISTLPSSVDTLVANLPYNVSVPILMHLLATFPSLNSALVMVQSEVGERLVAEPGTKIYGAPSVKASWYGHWSIAGKVSRQIFWPVPNVDSVLVRYQQSKTQYTDTDFRGFTSVEHFRQECFRLIDMAFGQRRKMLRQSLSQYFGGGSEASQAIINAGIDPTARPEDLALESFIELTRQAADVM